MHSRRISTGVAFYRIIWPSEQLKNQGVDVTLVPPGERDIGLRGVMDKHGKLIDVQIPADADVMVFQRVSHEHIAAAIPIIRSKGVAVIVEIDDDLTRIDPRNPAFNLLQPGTKMHPEHNWHNTVQACRDATAVVVSTPALLRRFATPQRGFVFDNYVQARLLNIPRVDHAEIGWPGSVHSHPGDLQAMGSSVNRLVNEGYKFSVIGNGEGVRQAWGIAEDTSLRCPGATDVHSWGEAVATLGVGVAPLADTQFNAAKSWLKMAEMAAVGVPCVGSPRAEYARINQLGIGTLAKDDKDWYRKLKLLADNEQARREMSERGREVMAGMTIEGNAWKLAEVWRDALKLERAKALGQWSRR